MSVPIGGDGRPPKNNGPVDPSTLQGRGGVTGWSPSQDDLNNPSAIGALQTQYMNAVQAYNANPTVDGANAVSQLFARIAIIAASAGSSNQASAAVYVNDPNLNPQNILKGNPPAPGSPGGGGSAFGAQAGSPSTMPTQPAGTGAIGGSGIGGESNIARQTARAMGTGAVGSAGPSPVSPGQAQPPQTDYSGAVDFLNDGATGGGGLGGPSPVKPATTNSANYINASGPVAPGNPGYGDQVAHTTGSPGYWGDIGAIQSTGVGTAPGWAGDAGLDVIDIYGDGSYNPFSDAGLTNLLNLYETQNGLPGYWSDEVLPFVQQQVALSYTNGQSPSAQQIVSGLPSIIEQSGQAGTYFDPGQGWQGFLSSQGIQTPGASGDPDAYGSLTPEQQIQQAGYMFATIAQGSMDDQFVQSGMYLIQEYGNQYIQMRATGQLPPGVNNFIDFLRLNGADSWM